jgi:hypothetical protein
VLGVADTRVRERVAAYRSAARDAVAGKAEELEGAGYVNYLSDMDHRI